MAERIAMAVFQVCFDTIGAYERESCGSCAGIMRLHLDLSAAIRRGDGSVHCNHEGEEPALLC